MFYPSAPLHSAALNHQSTLLLAMDQLMPLQVAQLRATVLTHLAREPRILTTLVRLGRLRSLQDLPAHLAGHPLVFRVDQPVNPQRARLSTRVVAVFASERLQIGMNHFVPLQCAFLPTLVRALGARVRFYIGMRNLVRSEDAESGASVAAFVTFERLVLFGRIPGFLRFFEAVVRRHVIVRVPRDDGVAGESVTEVFDRRRATVFPDSSRNRITGVHSHAVTSFGVVRVPIRVGIVFFVEFLSV